jgi:hypothetical protein
VQILLMQTQDSARQGLATAAVIDDVIGSGQALPSRGLRGHDALDLVLSKVAALGDAANLFGFRQVDHEHAIG